MFDRIAELGNRLSEWMGDKTQFGVGKNVSTDSETKLIDYTALCHLLPYEGYDPSTSIFHNKKSDGFVLEVSPLLGSNEEVENILFGMLTDILPNHADLQVLLWASPKIGNILNAFEKERSHHGKIYEWLARKRIEYLKNGVYKSLNQFDQYLLRNFRLIISVSIKRKKEEDNSHELISLREDIINSLKSIHMFSETIQVDSFITLMSDILHPSSSIDSTPYEWNPYDSISLQIPDDEYLIRHYKDKLVFQNEEDTVEARSYTVKKFPKEMRQWKMMDAIGQLFNNSLQIPCPFIISLSVRLVPKQENQMTESVKSASKKKDASQQGADGKLTIAREYEDTIFINQRMEEGDRKVKTHFQIILFTNPSDSSLAERKLRDLYRINGWVLKNTYFLQLQSFLSMLPMMMSEGMYEDLQFNGRLRSISALNTATILPFQAEWKGTKTPSLILPGRRGQIATFNPFDNTEGNYNLAIAAASGKGKSVFIQEYIISLLSAGGRVWVIDVGRSYEKTCKLLQGTFIEFTRDNHICLNPFTFIRDFNSSLTMLKPLLAAMVHPTSNASDEEIAYLEKAAKAAWDLKGNDATISTISDCLAKSEISVCKKLSHLLYSYTTDGMHAGYFEGPCNIDLNNPFVVLELQELKPKKDLQQIVLLLLMYHISEAMYLGDRSIPKSCIIDEAPDLFNSDIKGAEKFVNTGYRQARKYYANFVTSMQGVNDYFKNEATIAIYENSDIKIILGQNSETIDQLKKSERLSMDAYRERIFKSLRKTDEYSECVIITPSGLSIHRIILDPYMRILSSSKGEHYAMVKKFQEQNLSLEESIEKVAEIFIHEHHR
jgi:conjugal transfer ATP-binding protein TraC